MRHRWFMASCIVIILMGVAHFLAANVAPQPTPKPGDEATLHHLLRTFQVELPMAKRTTLQIMEGFGLFFTLASAVMGVVGLRMARQPGARRIAEVYAVGLAAMLVNSIVHWFIIPTSFLAIGLALCVFSLIPSRPSSAGNTQGAAA
jgi:hypothetical protein